MTRATLKPQQRLYFLKNHLVPKLYHRLVLSRSNGGVFRRLEKLVRRSLRSWLKLPHDAVNVLFHSEVREGGLGIPTFKLTIPLLKKARLDRLARVQDPVICALVTNSRTFANARRRCTNPPLKVGDAFVHSLTEAKRELELAAWGGGRLQPQVFTGRPLCTWLGKQRHGPPYRRKFHPRDKDKEWNRGHQTTSRSRKTWRCDACWRVESLGHVLQVCPRTSGHRIERHDATNKERINGNTGWRFKTPLLFWIDIETTGDAGDALVSRTLMIV